ncbi:MAG: leucine--tRNA ligase [Planctomycetes bacterium]|nr:leucine--tRNA ligase [Planctomycetota bacterium]MBI3833786.1 leucine--tRNA ligase [Planctomycetota bacterium]
MKIERNNTDRSEETVKPGRYDFTAIEAKWQGYWDEHQTFLAPNPGEAGIASAPAANLPVSPLGKGGGVREENLRTTQPKYYILDMFPYPSGAGLHVGHPVGYCATDIIARYKRMRGFNVLHPMGFDAFGLPAEQYAIETNVHPAVTTKKNIEMFRRQLKQFGFSYDWSREIATCDPSYYKWTQWMFARMFESWYDEECEWIGPDGRKIRGRARQIGELIAEFESGKRQPPPLPRVAEGDQSGSPKGGSASLPTQGEGKGERNASQVSWKHATPTQRRQILDGYRLAYLADVQVNWCPALGTVLSNEEVDSEGRSDRGGHPVFRRPLRQWMLRITKYADRLLSDLEGLDWPEPIKLMQRNWIGRSVGADAVFFLADRWDVKDGRFVHRASGKSPALNIPLESLDDVIRIYTTRPDTLFGATYMVLAPEHPLVDSLTTPDHRAEVARYVHAAARKSDMARTADSKEKTGVFSGAYALNPVSGQPVPIWIADYVLMGYGTGAIMGVPGSDERDFEFATAMNIPIVAVVKPTAEWIAQRVAAYAEQTQRAAMEGFERLLKENPEIRDSVQAHREQSKHLSDKTASVLKNVVGAERLIEHYVTHPASWGAAFVEESIAVNSPASSAPIALKDVCELNGLTTPGAKERITRWLERMGLGREAVNYKLRDWLFSRQRYWGEPFPVLHGEDGETIVVPDDELPVELPAMENFKPTASADDARSLPAPPLARAKEWLSVVRNGKRYQRDTNTMPQWAGSCWYYLRFMDPHNANNFCDRGADQYWMPVDLYVGGAEHAVLHLLYARFWHKVLFDLGSVSTVEPFQKLFNQGMIQGFAFRDARGLTVGPDAVEERGDDLFVLRQGGEPVTRIVAKMSKSLKNVVNPDEIISEYGADTFRLYEMYMGPLDMAKPWNTRDVPGLHKLCQRIWRLFVDESTGELSGSLTNDSPDDATLRALHKLVKKVTEELEQLKLNTGIAAMFDFVNTMTRVTQRSRAVLEPFVLVLAPFAPHLAEELWSRLGHSQSLAYEPWPAFDPRLARDEQVEIAVQVNGKIKAKIMVDVDAHDDAVQATAMADAKVMAAMENRSPRKVVVAKGRLVNIIV